MTRHDEAGTTCAAGERWDVLCEVVDNLGDAAVLWRLSRQLAREHGIAVRLFIDQPAVLARLVPGARPASRIDGVAIEAMDARAPLGEGCDVLISGFLARVPAPARARLRRNPAALLVQLEHLSAEAWIDGFHGLPSPGADGLVEHYFYPGFSPASGGLLRERDLLARRDTFQRDPTAGPRLLQALGIPARGVPARVVSLLSYPQPPLEALARALADDAALPMLDIVAPGSPDMPGAAGADADSLLALSRQRLQLHRVPFLPQIDYDALLWACDLNIVRGEDSWVRALWAARPLLWQAYPQTGGADRIKLEAFLSRFGDSAEAMRLADAHRWWNAPQTDARPLARLLHDLDGARRCTARLTAELAAAPDLASQLVAFAAARRQGRSANQDREQNRDR